MVAAETLTHMAATSNWSIGSLRNATLELCDRKNWTTNRLAAEIGMLQSTVEKFINGGAPSPRLRELLIVLMGRMGVEPPEPTEPAPIRPRGGIAYFAEQPDKPDPVAVSEPEAEPEAVEDEPEGEPSDPEAVAAAEDEARLIAAFRRIGFEFPQNVVDDLRAVGVTLIAPPKPEPRFSVHNLTRRELDRLIDLMTDTPGGEAYIELWNKVINATPDEAEAN